MHNDRELLELAAKAGGIELTETEDGYEADSDDSRIWNPLADDGDALRLAIKLAIDVWRPGDNAVHAVGSFGKESVEPLSLNPYAATRLAIVRAAAEIGKEKE